MAVKAPSAAWAWLFWLLLGCGWVIMLAGVSALQQVCGGWLESCHYMPAGPRRTMSSDQTTLFMLSSCFLAQPSCICCTGLRCQQRERPRRGWHSWLPRPRRLRQLL
jgi:hypothetical protein